MSETRVSDKVRLVRAGACGSLTKSADFVWSGPVRLRRVRVVEFGSKDKKGSPYSITERTVPELIPALGSQPAGDVNHKPDQGLKTLKFLSTCIYRPTEKS